jgi:hypothetical protein
MNIALREANSASKDVVMEIDLATFRLDLSIISSMRFRAYRKSSHGGP